MGLQIAGPIVAAVMLGVLSLSVWLVMMVQGAIVSEFGLTLSTWSFWQSALVVLALSIIGGFFRQTAK